MLKGSLKQTALVGLVLILVLGSALLGGCTKEEEKTTDPAAETLKETQAKPLVEKPKESPAKPSVEDTIFKLASPWAPKSIDPTIAGYISTRMHIAETLVSIDYEGSLTPCLAKSWEVSEDGLTWTFNLREDVKFHNGEALNAEAVKASLSRAFEKAATLKALPIKEIRVVAQYAIAINTTEPFAPLAGYLAGGCSAIISLASVDEKGEFVKVIATGPFQFDSWVPKESITGVKFDDYWGTKPKLEKVVYLGVPDAKTRETMLRAGEIDMARLLPPGLAQELNKDPDITVYTKTRMGRVRQLLLNTAKPPLDAIRVRKAINYAIDRELVCATILEGIGEPAIGPFSFGLKWANRNLEGYSYDPEKAQSLLEEAGWLDADNDGVRGKNGEELELDLFTYTTRPALPVIAEAIKDQLGKVGIRINIRIMDGSAIKAQAKEGKVDLYLMARSVLWNNDPDSWAADFLPESTYQSYINYHPSQVVSLVEKGREAMEFETRKEIYDGLQEKILEDAPLAYLTYYTNVIAVRSDVHGYEIHPTEYCFHLENVYEGEK